MTFYVCIFLFPEQMYMYVYSLDITLQKCQWYWPHAISGCYAHILSTKYLFLLPSTASLGGMVNYHCYYVPQR